MLQLYPSHLLTGLLLLCFLPFAGGQPFALQGEGFDSHVELSWVVPAGISPENFRILRAHDSVNFSPLKMVTQTRSLDFTGFASDSPDTYYYYVQALSGIGQVLATSDTVVVTVAEMTDEALLEMVQRYTFRYFWDFAHPVSGMARERNTSDDIVTTGGTGFGIMAILVGIERGFITREEGREQMLKIASFLQFADRFHGVFPHWMNGVTGNVYPFSEFDNGGDLVETAFLMQGLLAARQYFDQNDAAETALREAITQLWEAVDWNFYRKNNSGVLYWHWSPNYGWQMNFPIRGFNEAMIVYILAIASPTHPVPASLWDTGWTAQNYASGLTWYGFKLDVGPPLGGPLFFAHYSFLGFDPRDKKDEFTNYYTRNRNHTLVNRAYCIDNPENHEHYSAQCWGLTASDDPFGYLAHEALPPRDNGTISPTAALSSTPYTPTESLATLKHFYRDHGGQLWGEFGFYDAFNLDEDWFATSYLAIDQGPIVAMIENYRSGLLWDLFMANPEIQPALDAIGFVPDASAVGEPGKGLNWSVFPNPAGGQATVHFFLEKQQDMTLKILDLQGRLVQQILEENFPAGEHFRTFNPGNLPPGMYFLRLQCPTESTTKIFVIDS